MFQVVLIDQQGIYSAGIKPQIFVLKPCFSERKNVNRGHKKPNLRVGQENPSISNLFTVVRVIANDVSG
jgi:hypothetical protein